MIEISGIKLRLASLDGTEADELQLLRETAARMLRIRPGDIATLEPRRRSIDARKKADVHLTWTVRIELGGGAKAEKALLTRLRKSRTARQVASVTAEPVPPTLRDARPSARKGRDTSEADPSSTFALPQPLPSNVRSDPPHTSSNSASRSSPPATSASSRESYESQGFSTLPVVCPASARRPVVVGAGCAGLFCALALAEAGLEPLLIERGDGSRGRTAAIRTFNETGVLDPESNIQYGLGGAGTFSDGKLSTGTKSPYHRTILETFVEAGAPRRILWDAKPHVGSDVLPHVVEHILARIRAAGGEVRLRTRLVDIDTTGGSIRSVTILSREEPHSQSSADVQTPSRKGGTSNPAREAPSTSGLAQADPRSSSILHEERIPCTELILACGHSARDVYQLLRNRGVALERKTFAMGMRIEHLQADIDRAQYGPAAGHPALGAAPYKLAVHLPAGRGAFSFCMCPGGYVVAAASEPEGVVTNGMSLSDRAGTNANAGLLANVFPADLPGDDVLAGIGLQRQCERAAYDAGGGGYVAPAQLVGDFLARVPSSVGGAIQPTYPRGVAWGNLDPCLPPYVAETLREALPLMARKLHGFDRAEAVLTGVETRSSSPVRVVRGSDGQSVSTSGLFPCGEGAGYAGGIMSAAADGLRCAAWVLDGMSR